MKQILRKIVLASVAITGILFFSSFVRPNENKPLSAYNVELVSKTQVGTNYEWVWSVSNPNPGNGSNGTLQNISHWSMPLSLQAESALVGARYSYDGITWYNVPVSVERDPSIRLCTTVDVLKFDIGTSGTAPTYYSATFNADYVTNPYAVSYIKTGGGLQGCNVYYFAGIGGAN